MKDKWIRGGCIAAAFLMVAALFLGAYEIGRLNVASHLIHRLEHIFYYGGMAFLLACGLGRRRYWIALVVVPLVGALDEIHQFYTPGRSSSAYDWLTDVVGTAIAMWLYSRWTRSREKNEARGERKEGRP